MYSKELIRNIKRNQNMCDFLTQSEKLIEVDAQIEIKAGVGIETGIGTAMIQINKIIIC